MERAHFSIAKLKLVSNYPTVMWTALLAGLLFCLSAQAQRHGQRPGRTASVQLTGKVVDAATGEALAYTSIAILAMPDSALVTGTLTDEKGHFVLEVQPGTYLVQIDFLGYARLTHGPVRVTPDLQVRNLGKLALEASTQTLGEVEVRAERSSMQVTLDKRVFNVGKDLASQGGTAADVLDNVPSVQVDVEGNVSLRGSQSVRILVDGKPSSLIGLSDASGLRQIPANLIDRIEVITNPSARYEAEGMAGIINIVLRKERGKGINGSIDLNAGLPTDLGAAFNLNFRRRYFNLFGSYGFGLRTGPGGGSLYQEFFPADTTYILQQTRQHERGGRYHSFRFGSDFFLSPQDVLTASFTARLSKQRNTATLWYRDFLNSLDNPIGRSTRTDDEDEDEQNYDWSLDYAHRFPRKGHKLTARLSFESSSEAEVSDYREVFFDGQGAPSGRPDLFQRSSSDQLNRRWLAQADYVQPFGKQGRFEAGLRSTWRYIANDYLVEELRDEAWVSLETLSNDFRYDEIIHAAYAMAGNKLGRFSYQLGLRFEYSDVRTELQQTSEVNHRRYPGLFPTAHFTYELGNDHALQLSYSRRLRRPHFYYLNPFLSYSDARNFHTGNPDLDPEYTHSFELGHIKYLPKGTVASSIYYRHATGVIQRIRTINAQGITISRPENLATEDAVGFELTGSYNPFDWWRNDMDFNLFYARTDGTNLGQRFQAETVSWFMRYTARLKWREADFQIRFNYRAPRNTTQGRSKAMWYADLAASRDLMDKKATLTLSVRDLFNTRKWRYLTLGEDFFTEGEFQWRARQLRLSLNYRINQDKARRPRRGEYRGEGMEDMAF